MNWFKSLFNTTEVIVNINVPESVEFNGEKDLLAFKTIMDEVVEQIRKADLTVWRDGHFSANYYLDTLSDRLDDIASYNLKDYVGKMKLNGNEANYLINERLKKIDKKTLQEYVNRAISEILRKNCEWGEVYRKLQEQQIKSIDDMIKNDEISELLRGVLQVHSILTCNLYSIV